MVNDYDNVTSSSISKPSSCHGIDCNWIVPPHQIQHQLLIPLIHRNMIEHDWSRCHWCLVTFYRSLCIALSQCFFGVQETTKVMTPWCKLPRQHQPRPECSLYAKCMQWDAEQVEVSKCIDHCKSTPHAQGSSRRDGLAASEFALKGQKSAHSRYNDIQGTVTTAINSKPLQLLEIFFWCFQDMVTS